MKFCPKCGKKLSIKKKNNENILFCKKCGYEEEVKEVLVSTKKLSSKEVIMETIKEETAPLPTTTDVKCPVCGHNEAYWWTVQTRSADEPTTQFFRCVKCNHTWREYG
ncbi:MAG: transcription factor S [Nanopusillaceae archaeon]